MVPCWSPLGPFFVLVVAAVYGWVLDCIYLIAFPDIILFLKLNLWLLVHYSAFCYRDRCFNCGKTGHLARECRERYLVVIHTIHIKDEETERIRKDLTLTEETDQAQDLVLLHQEDATVDPNQDHHLQKESLEGVLFLKPLSQHF